MQSPLKGIHDFFFMSALMLVLDHQYQCVLRLIVGQIHKCMELNCLSLARDRNAYRVVYCQLSKFKNKKNTNQFYHKLIKAVR